MIKQVRVSKSRLKWLWQMLVPVGVGIICVLIPVLPIHLPNGMNLVPLLLLVLIYFWSVHQPAFLSPVMVFLLGLFQDIVSGDPIGMAALVYLVVQGLILSQRRVFKGLSFALVWLGLGLASLCYVFLIWLAATLYSWQIAPVLGLGVQWLMTIVLYPVIGAVFTKIHHLVYPSVWPGEA